MAMNAKKKEERSATSKNLYGKKDGRTVQTRDQAKIRRKHYTLQCITEENQAPWSAPKTVWGMWDSPQ